MANAEGRMTEADFVLVRVNSWFPSGSLVFDIRGFLCVGFKL